MGWNDARINCLKNEADLASFSNKEFVTIKEHLEQVQVHLLGARTISIGLYRINNNWKWLDGRAYNGTLPLERFTKGQLAWIDEENGWILKAAKFSKSDLYFCEKMRGDRIILNIFFFIVGESMNLVAIFT